MTLGGGGAIAGVNDLLGRGKGTGKGKAIAGVG